MSPDVLSQSIFLINIMVNVQFKLIYLCDYFYPNHPVRLRPNYNESSPSVSFQIKLLEDVASKRRPDIGLPYGVNGTTDPAQTCRYNGHIGTSGRRQTLR